MTYQDARVDDASGSKPEHETHVENPAAVHAMLRGLGYVPFIEFEKHCRTYDFEARGRQMLATLVQVPESDRHFIELETIVEEDQVHGALADVRAVLGDVGHRRRGSTTDTYTDAVAAGRKR